MSTLEQFLNYNFKSHNIKRVIREEAVGYDKYKA